MAIPFILPELLQPKIVQLARVILNNLSEIDYNQWQNIMGILKIMFKNLPPSLYNVANL